MDSKLEEEIGKTIYGMSKKDFSTLVGKITSDSRKDIFAILADSNPGQEYFDLTKNKLIEFGIPAEILVDNESIRYAARAIMGRAVLVR